MPADRQRRVLITLAAALAPVLGGSGATGGTGDTSVGSCDDAPDELCIPWAPEVQGDCPPAGPDELQFGCLAQDVSGPVFADGQCCYTVGGWSYAIGCGCSHGRALLIEAHPRAAAPAILRGWSARLRPDLSGLDAGGRRQLAGFWASVAVNEHASIASFHRAAFELLALGAPARLVSAVHRAAADEVRHARQAFALASAFAGAPIGPRPLDLPDALPLARAAEEIAVRTAREACVEETLSLGAAIAMEDAAREPVVKRVLAGIVRDEARHVRLAWRLVRWLAPAGVPRAAFAIPRLSPSPPRPPHLARWGCLGDDVLVPLARAAHAQIVLPAAERLCV